MEIGSMLHLFPFARLPVVFHYPKESEREMSLFEKQRKIV
jgi:hypothetical protein